MHAALFLPHLGVTGGQGVYCRTLLRGLLAAGDDRFAVYIPADPKQLFPKSGIDDGWKPLAANPRVRIIPLDWPRDHALALPLDRVLAGPLRTNRPDVLHSSYYNALQDPVCPQVVTYHDAGFLEHPELYGDSGVRRRATADLILPHVARIIGDSHDAAARLSRLLPFPAERTDGVHLGLPDEPADYRNARLADPTAPLWAGGETVAEWGAYVFLPVGAATGVARRRKNVPTAVTAFGLLRATNRSGRRLIIASNGIIHPQMLVELLGADRAAAAGAMHGEAWRSEDDSVRVEPDLSRPAFLRALAGARAVLYPSRYEGFGLPTIEAMAAEVPLAAANATSIPEIAGDAALLFDPDDPAAAASALERVLTDDGLRADLIARGRRRVGEFSVENLGRATRAVYERAVGA